MISDFETNTIYFSELLKTDFRFSETLKQLIAILDGFGAKEFVFIVCLICALSYGLYTSGSIPGDAHPTTFKR